MLTEDGTPKITDFSLAQTIGRPGDDSERISDQHGVHGPEQAGRARW